MKTIRILTRFPVILTKDPLFMKQLEKPVRDGAVYLLPADAVLVMPPENLEVANDVTDMQLKAWKPGVGDIEASEAGGA